MTVASEPVVIRGTIKAYEDITLRGRIEGTIEVPNHVLTIGLGAHVTAEIVAKKVVVSGTVMGNLTATEQVVLKDQAAVSGDIVAPSVVIIEGARFDGRIDRPIRAVVTTNAA